MRPALLFVLLALGCRPVALSPGTAASPPRLDLERVARQVHAQTNAERQRLGLSVLAWRDDLARLAAGHSADMAARTFFAHVNPDGADVNARARALGLECRQTVGNVVYTGFSENLFKTATVRSWREETDQAGTRRTYDYRAEDDFAPEIVQGWMHSPGHRANIVEPVNLAEGVALVLAPDGTVYVTQVFC